MGLMAHLACLVHRERGRKGQWMWYVFQLDCWWRSWWKITLIASTNISESSGRISRNKCTLSQFLRLIPCSLFSRPSSLQQTHIFERCLIQIALHLPVITLIAFLLCRLIEQQTVSISVWIISAINSHLTLLSVSQELTMALPPASEDNSI